ncbi:DUF6503 family protein [Adhaeribacter radiodurans]|uniref:Deoxyribose-phosphate aldolase n=1 Tax=Adhaeribacter radiodurans TaxID=2745197 RepID=A0A7L7L628_9BACT|nr:DUF6503 family protein [Adhaeribacter radiodurans]QMU28233.1 hypothetical protein HUW48_09350 [Adhaeribacter radiodurans]
MRHYQSYLSFLLLLIACQSSPNQTEMATDKVQEIIDKAIEVHGGKKFEKVNLAFDFRGRHYEAQRQAGSFTYTRSFTDSTGQVKDVLKNDSFTRTIDNQVKSLPEERIKAFTASINSVIYFALLPFGLNDPAVKKELLDTITIRQIPYYKIKVTFNQEGGGEDFQDEFLYYINQKSGTMDYFAYTYATEGGGIRFRQAINPREIGGIRFQDYINFEPVGKINFWQIEDLFNAGKLKEFSRIELKNIQVKEL